MKKVLLWIWQLPQNLVGYFLSRKSIKTSSFDGIKVYFVKNGSGSAATLGEYIIVDAQYIDFPYKSNVVTARHEHGHQVQSKYLGPLYLIVVGIPSVINNLWDRFFHKKWSNEKRDEWYYGRFPENWADKLGEVER